MTDTAVVNVDDGRHNSENIVCSRGSYACSLGACGSIAAILLMMCIGGESGFEVCGIKPDLFSECVQEIPPSFHNVTLSNPNPVECAMLKNLSQVPSVNACFGNALNRKSWVSLGAGLDLMGALLLIAGLDFHSRDVKNNYNTPKDALYTIGVLLLSLLMLPPGVALSLIDRCSVANDMYSGCKEARLNTAGLMLGFSAMAVVCIVTLKNADQIKAAGSNGLNRLKGLFSKTSVAAQTTGGLETRLNNGV